MTNKAELNQSFATTFWLMGKFAEDLTHADSVQTPPFRANSFNWVFGHILVSRDRVLTALGAEPVLRDEERVLYETGAGLVDLETAVSLERLLAALESSQASIVQAVETANEADLEAFYDEDKGVTVADRIEGLHWHETYHVGQLEILRQVSGEREAFP